MTRPGLEHGRALVAWIDDAQYAVDTAPTLSVAHVLALVAQPDGTQRAQAGITWWLEEARRVLRDEVADRMPADPAALTAWRHRQESRAARVDGLLAAHVEALLAAGAIVPRERDADQATPAANHGRPARPRRASKADRALAARTDASRERITSEAA